MSHTPGPWTILAEDCRVYAEDDYPVALASSHRESKQRLANAHLIAAAPDLLAMLEELLPELQCRCHLAFTSRGKHDPKTLCHHADAVKSAIAKARGQG